MRTEKIVASIAVAVMICICIAPVMAEGSDGATSMRSANKDVYEGTFEKKSGYMSNYYNTLYFIDGSDNHKAMKAYVADPTNQNNKVMADDFEILRNSQWSGTVHVYSWTSSVGEGKSTVGKIDEANLVVDMKKAVDAYGKISFFVKAGDTVKINMTATNNRGEDAKPYFSDPEYQNVSVSSYERQYKVSYNIVIHFDNDGLYSDVSYNVSGISEPNGSATAYFIFCAIVTFLVLAILAYSALKPKWSK